MKICFYELKDYEYAFVEKLSKKYGYETGAMESKGLDLENLGLAEGCDAISVLGFSRLDEVVIKKLSEMGVRYIATRTVGFNHVDLQSAKKYGITVLHAVYDSTNVADFTVMAILMLIRKIKVSVCRGLVNNFSLDEIMGKDLRNLTIGVIGTGKIGANVISNLSGFGCKILCYDMFENQSVKAYAKYVELDELYSQCDIITLHVPQTADNFHMIDEEVISKMKDGVMIINTARGTLIDTNALVHAIEEGKVSGVALDTIEGEEGICHVDIKTRITNKQNIFYLKQFPNVLYTPHIAFFTEEAVYQMVESAFEGICREEAGTENVYKVY